MSTLKQGILIYSISIRINRTFSLLFSVPTSRILRTYHDWVAPEGYFTGRGREVPPGCEEIDEAERRRRERESMQLMVGAFEEHHPDEPTMHPSVAEERGDE